jgi:hypothetical protein
MFGDAVTVHGHTRRALYRSARTDAGDVNDGINHSSANRLADGWFNRLPAVVRPVGGYLQDAACVLLVWSRFLKLLM